MEGSYLALALWCGCNQFSGSIAPITTTDGDAVLDKIANAVNQLGVEVEQVHGESAGGQFEVVTAHEEAMTVRKQPLRRAGALRKPELVPCLCFCM